jgi:myo-inositol 2-dehydrogenase/D-chiro-inositol 1-dehydrogenase
LKEAIEGGIIGRPVAFKGVHRNESIPSNFPADSTISQAAIHDIDSCRWLLGQEIEEVYVQGTRVDRSLSSDVRELLLLHFSLAGDRLASIEVHLSARYGYEVSAEIIGELGVVTTNQPASINVRVNEERSTKIQPDWLGRFQEAYVAELENWVASLNGHSFDGADAWDGYVSLVISDACINSLVSGRPERVTLPKKPTLYN